jgi:diaminohydroxyphosphoribosylaminopyrimidine deaminase/5-amino-6-(5-phosphoribosylamino)uracil reductase
MSHALQLAERGLQHTSPNPRVGCVLVKNGDVIGQGYHQQAGSAHAEVNALADAKAHGFSTEGATAYVTLEPCSHHGKTPPCAEALISAGIHRVVIGSADPNPLVAGKGIQALHDAGIDVIAPVLEEQAKALNPGFIKRMQFAMPWVFSKIASSLDGRTAMQSGESFWITGEQSRADVQALRARSCAIISGIGTIEKDDPQLTVRDPRFALNGVIRQPLKVIIDSKLSIQPSANILANKNAVLVVYAQASAERIEALSALGIELLQCANADGKVDLTAMLKDLALRGCNDVMLEAGAKLNGAFLTAGLIDDIFIYLAPTLLGSSARGQFEMAFSSMTEQRRLQLIQVRQIGDDLRLHYRPQAPSNNERSN